MNDVIRFDCTSGGVAWCQGCYTMTESKDGEYVLHDDYDALLAEHEALLRRVAEAPSREVIGHHIQGRSVDILGLKWVAEPPLPSLIGKRVRILAEVE